MTEYRYTHYDFEDGDTWDVTYTPGPDDFQTDDFIIEIQDTDGSTTLCIDVIPAKDFRELLRVMQAAWMTRKRD